jgi:hypothetical protein
MSSKKLMSRQKSRGATRAEGWRDAIDYAGVLLARSDDPEKRKRLEAAIRWFKQRMQSGEPYPAIADQSSTHF